ncbi:MAG: glycosyltransferase [Cyanobacteria bacterium P01_C01_bin.70]
MTKPTVSIVIPCYNAEKTIAATINSVLSQTFADLELIVINDGSTDETLNVIDQIDDDRLQVFTFENAGPQKSRNRGIDKATGDYISLIDADDLWTVDKLHSQLTALQSAPDAAVAYSWTDVIDEHGQIIQTGRRSRAEGHVFAALIQDNFLGSGSNPLIKANALRAVGGFDERILAGQDWDMWLTLAAHYSFVVVPQVQILYRKVLSARSWSSNLSRQEKGLMQVMKKHFRSGATLQADNSNLSDIRQSACVANCYRYLLFECFEKCAYSFPNGLLALRFFSRSLLLQPSWWVRRHRLIFVVLLKSAKYLFALPQIQRKAHA